MARANMIRRKYHDRLVLDIVETREAQETFRDDVERGLGDHPKHLSPKYFYDERGSQLFERITELEEYYPTRIEAELLQRHGQEILTRAGEGLTMIELGSGSSTKTRLLLDILSARQGRVDYVPIDISPTVVTEFGEQLLVDYPSLHIRGLICDYHQALALLQPGEGQPRLMLFLGSSMGNFTPGQEIALLKAVREAMAAEDRLLLGLDLKKDPGVLNLAYNDTAGVTAEFNLNLLTRINRELGGRFDLERFRHHAFYNQNEGRIEMHLESLVHQLVPVQELGRSYTFREGETIHTENSYKFDREGLEAMLAECGLSLEGHFTDEQGWFSLNLIAPE